MTIVIKEQHCHFNTVMNPVKTVKKNFCFF